MGSSFNSLKKKTVSGKVSRGGSHDTKEDGLTIIKLTCSVQKVNANVNRQI
ncbi:MAG: hypothetical protein QG663_1168 [Thermodesulfobacteriota bacterium]|nr:hypothetical protein [Thermodesulfobacteriota bacterium]